MKNTKYYIIELSNLTTEVFERGYQRMKEGIEFEIVPFTKNETFKEEFIYSYNECVNFGFDPDDELK
jgi:hypothetical protein